MDAPNHLPIFQGLPGSELQWLLDHGQTLDLAKGDFLMCEGDPAPRFYITLAGELQITRTINGQEVVRGTTPPGIMAGEISLLYNTPSQVSVLPFSPVACVGFRPPTFRQLFAACPVMSARSFRPPPDRACCGFAINVKHRRKWPHWQTTASWGLPTS